jgi:hypothetical protein
MPLTQDEKALHTLARERIETGELPRDVGKSIWAGDGKGDTCVLCNRPVVAKQIEFEVEDPGGRSFRFHMRCHAIWQLALSSTTSG